MSTDRPACDPLLWLLDEKVTYLNHGAFGAAPCVLLEFQRQLRERIERQPMRFFVRDLEPLLDQARSELAAFLHAEPQDLVFVPNATAGVNTVLRSLRFEAGDELLVTNLEYNASRNALDYAAEQSGARVVVATIPFPIHSTESFLEPILEKVTSRTRLALFDHVTSQTGVILPLERLVGELSKRGVDTLIDGAHAPGMVPLDLQALGATYYTGNCHKWLCAPKAAGFLHVRRDRQPFIRPLSISHGANSRRADRSRFLIEFGWTGTGDPSTYLTVPEALRYMGSLLPGGWPALMRRNHELVVAARELICRRIGVDLPCPSEMLGSLASIPISDTSALPKGPLYLDLLQEKLLADHGIEVPVISWPAPPRRLLRISAQLYNHLPQYERLAGILAGELAPYCNR